MNCFNDLDFGFLNLGKQRFLKLILVGSFEGMNLKPIKITEPKLCTRFTCSMSRNNTVCLICVASNRSLFIFEIARVQGRHKRLKEISCPYIVQSINFVRDGDWICVGSSNYFAMFSIWTDGPAQGRDCIARILVTFSHI